ncbi:MAG: cytidine deaminase [Fodinibius sp.]|nr:cytidine deaminase [Fodinibius sp.]
MDINDLYERAYVPYSEAPSAAVVYSQQGQWFPGVRIENISYPLSISASQNALFNCLSEGHQPKQLFAETVDSSMAMFWEHEFDIELYALDNADLSSRVLPTPVLANDIDIHEQLESLLDHAVVAESNFPVSALVSTADGFYAGVNIECSAWDMGLCAERVAIAKALTYGSTPLQSLHIHTRFGEFSSPCGACRQVISEHLAHKQIHLYHSDGSRSIHFSEDLLPHSFQSSSLSNH